MAMATSVSSLINASVFRSIRSRCNKLLSSLLEVPESSIHDDSVSEDLGVDSLLGTELLGEVTKEFALEIPTDEFSNLLRVKQLIDYLQSRLGGAEFGFDGESSDRSSSTEPDPTEPVSQASTNTTVNQDVATSLDKVLFLEKDGLLGTKPADSETKRESSTVSEGFPIRTGQHSFDSVREEFDLHAARSGFSNFWSHVYPSQSRLVTTYVVEAFERLDCPLSYLKDGEELPSIKVLRKHHRLLEQLYNILEEASLIHSHGPTFLRTGVQLNLALSARQFKKIIEDFPAYASEHNLLHITASKLAECLGGEADPLVLLFRKKEKRSILEDVYRNGPMYKAVTEQLASFLTKALARAPPTSYFNILEIGAGTGGTTNRIVRLLSSQQIPFRYTFTDVGSSLVAAARKNFKEFSNMDFRVLDIETEPSSKLPGRYDIILSTNCIHATKNLTTSSTNIHKMLRKDGFLALVEFTRNIYWFDLVFGLLDGWWLFEDGRRHVLADQWFWDSSLRSAGFEHVTRNRGDAGSIGLDLKVQAGDYATYLCLCVT